MSKLHLPALAAASVFLVCNAQADPYASSVQSYASGTGFIPGYDNPATALGQPTATDSFGFPIDPFYSPWETNNVVSVGTGGSLTVRFATPIANSPSHAYGMDFIIFGNNFFTITNNDYLGGGITDGALFNNDSSATRVSVSQDGTTFYQLNPSLAPIVDALFPTDASGNFTRPVNPALTSASFAGRDMAGIRALYDGSGGGTGYDIGWAQDGGGQSVALENIQFVRVEVLGGHAEIDGFSAVPEPGTWVMCSLGLGLAWVIRRRQS